MLLGIFHYVASLDIVVHFDRFFYAFISPPNFIQSWSEMITISFKIYVFEASTKQMTSFCLHTHRTESVSLTLLHFLLCSLPNCNVNRKIMSVSQKTASSFKLMRQNTEQ